jgi:hypothetical protein
MPCQVGGSLQILSTTRPQPLREDTRRRFPFSGLVFGEYNAPVTLSTGATETLIPANEGIAFSLGTMDTFVTYGARRVWHDLLAEGVTCGLHRIQRLMRQHGLKARPRRRRLPPDLGERQASAVAPNVLDRAFAAPARNRRKLVSNTNSLGRKSCQRATGPR